MSWVSQNVHSFTFRVFQHLYLSSLESIYTHNHLTADLIEFFRPILVNGINKQEKREWEWLHCAFLCLWMNEKDLLFVSYGQITGNSWWQWVREVALPVPDSSLHAHWYNLSPLGMAVRYLSTWLGKVLVVSFCSCLDVTAISMDMGEALKVSMALTAVSIPNCECVLVLVYWRVYEHHFCMIKLVCTYTVVH